MTLLLETRRKGGEEGREGGREGGRKGRREGGKKGGRRGEGGEGGEGAEERGGESEGEELFLITSNVSPHGLTFTR